MWVKNISSKYYEKRKNEMSRLFKINVFFYQMSFNDNELERKHSFRLSSNIFVNIKSQISSIFIYLFNQLIFVTGHCTKQLWKWLSRAKKKGKAKDPDCTINRIQRDSRLNKFNLKISFRSLRFLRRKTPKTTVSFMLCRSIVPKSLIEKKKKKRTGEWFQ